MHQIGFVLSLLILSVYANSDATCQFSVNFSPKDLSQEGPLEDFIQQYFYWESKFVRELGVDKSTGLAINGQTIHMKTGKPDRESEKKASFGQEAIHLALLTKVLGKEENANLFYSEEEALILLSRKLSTYENILLTYISSERKETLIETDEGVINFKNEEIEKMFWTVFSLVHVLQQHYPNKDNFISRWASVEDSLSSVFFAIQGQERKDNDYERAWAHMLMPFLETEDRLELLRSQELQKFASINERLLSLGGAKDTPSQERVLRAQDPHPPHPLEDFFSPQSLMSLFLVEKEGAFHWLNYILSREGGQSRFGAISENECHLSEELCYLSWQSKVAPVLSIMGGLSDTILERIRSDGNSKRYSQKAQTQSLFENFLEVSDQLVLPPSELVPKFRENFVSCRQNVYPADFAWGTATASYQIEGAWNEDGKGPNIWDDFVRIPGRINNGDTGDVADDFYHKYEMDIEMMRELGIKHFRLSLSWSRLLPDGTTNSINWAGVAFYNDVIDKLLEAGIEPFITLYHWDLPSGLMQDKSKDGWLNPDIQDYFNDYADLCFSAFGDRVKHWITFNEPLSFTWLGYGIGLQAPGRCSDYISGDCSWVGDGGDTPTEPYITTHNVILAHAKAVRTYREKYQQTQGGVIGMCTQAEFGEPWDPNSQDDIDAANTKIEYDFGWYNDPLVFGQYPDSMIELEVDGRMPTFTEEESELVKGSFDFIGLNHYTSKFVHHTGEQGRDWGNDGRFWTSEYNIYGELIGPYAGTGWLNVYPEGMRKILNWIDARYGHQQVYIFENGVTCPNENDMPIEDALHDSFRTEYYSEYIQNMQAAMEEDGVDVRGYFAWSIMDNFEWTAGYDTRFGMVYIDYENDQERHIKDSAYWYAGWIQSKTNQ